MLVTLHDKTWGTIINSPHAGYESHQKCWMKALVCSFIRKISSNFWLLPNKNLKPAPDARVGLTSVDSTERPEASGRRRLCSCASTSAREIIKCVSALMPVSALTSMSKSPCCGACVSVSEAGGREPSGVMNPAGRLSRDTLKDYRSLHCHQCRCLTHQGHNDQPGVPPSASALHTHTHCSHNNIYSDLLRSQADIDIFMRYYPASAVHPWCDRASSFQYWENHSSLV